MRSSLAVTRPRGRQSQSVLCPKDALIEIEVTATLATTT
jgi:hypothetical protein